jgi:hypothetical protein
MTGIVAYLDDSGTHLESSAIVVAGCVALTEHWDAFVPHWSSVLTDFGVSCHHNVDCVHRQGEYKGWSDQKRIDYFVNLVDSISEVCWFVLGGAIRRRDYDDVIPQEFKSAIIDPFFFPFQICIESLLTALTPDIADNEQVAFVFDQKKGLEGKASVSFRIIKATRDKHDRLGSIEFRDRRKAVPLQAADLIVNEIYMDYARERPRRKSMEYLLQKVNPLVKHIPREGLVQLVEQFRRDHRQIDALFARTKKSSKR